MNYPLGGHPAFSEMGVVHVFKISLVPPMAGAIIRGKGEKHGLRRRHCGNPILFTEILGCIRREGGHGPAALAFGFLEE